MYKIIRYNPVLGREETLSVSSPGEFAEDEMTAMEVLEMSNLSAKNLVEASQKMIELAEKLGRDRHDNLVAEPVNEKLAH